MVLIFNYPVFNHILTQQKAMNIPFYHIRLYNHRVFNIYKESISAL